MKLKLNIRRKISLFILIPLSIYIIILVTFIGIRFTRQAEFDNDHTCQLLSERSAAHAEIVLKDHQSNIKTLSNTLSGKLTTLDSTQREFFKQTIANVAQGQNYWMVLPSTFYADSNYQSSDWVLIQAHNGTIIVNDDNGIISSNFGKVIGTNGTEIYQPYEHNNQWLMNISAPIFQNDNICGYIGKAINIKDFDFLANKVAQAFNQEVTKHLINNNGTIVYSSNFDDINKKFTIGCSDTSEANTLLNTLAKGEYWNNSFEKDGIKMSSYFAPINIGKNCNWSLALTFPISNLAQTSANEVRSTFILAIAGLLIMIVLIYFIAKNMTTPIKETTDALKHLAIGDTEGINIHNIKTNDELEEMSASLNQVVDGIRKSETFALNIGKGDFESEFHSRSNKDRLGEALIKMRDSLVESQKKETERKEEEELRNWSTGGIAKFGEILRKNQDNMKTLGYNIMSNLIDYLKVNQGALFVINDDDENDIYFTMVTAIAYGRDKFVHKDIREGDGLVGRCVYERKTIYLTEIPDDYIKITSGLGTANPKCILIVPCIINNEIYGVIEIASFTELKQYEIEFVEKLGESIASTLASVKVTEKTAKLLSDSQIKSDELTSQEEELRQNLEEMQATQEDLRRQMEENTTMRENLAKEQALMDSLMSNSSAIIYFKDLDLNYMKVSSSYLSFFNMTEDQIIGKSDADIMADKVAAQKSLEDEMKIIKTQKALPEEIREVKLADGKSVYLKFQKCPLFDVNGRIMGVFGVMSDISDIIK